MCECVGCRGCFCPNQLQACWELSCCHKIRRGSSVTVIGVFLTGNAIVAVTPVYEDGSRPDNVFHRVGVDEEMSETKTNMFVGTDVAEDTGEGHGLSG